MRKRIRIAERIHRDQFGIAAWVTVNRQQKELRSPFGRPDRPSVQARLALRAQRLVERLEYLPAQVVVDRGEVGEQPANGGHVLHIRQAPRLQGGHDVVQYEDHEAVPGTLMRPPAPRG
jgi:hypothetical protein